jgi:hypothetical protein
LKHPPSIAECADASLMQLHCPPEILANAAISILLQKPPPIKLQYPDAVFKHPPETTAPQSEIFDIPPPTNANGLIAQLVTPPTTDEQSAHALLELPPPTKLLTPNALLPAPPTIAEFTPVAQFEQPPATRPNIAVEQLVEPDNAALQAALAKLETLHRTDESAPVEGTIIPHWKEQKGACFICPVDESRIRTCSNVVGVAQH